MSKMDRKTALEILKNFRDSEGPYCTEEELYQAIDVAIHELERLCQEPPKREYYGQ
jgi:hypothetical protein